MPTTLSLFREFLIVNFISNSKNYIYLRELAAKLVLVLAAFLALFLGYSGTFLTLVLGMGMTVALLVVACLMHTKQNGPFGFSGQNHSSALDVHTMVSKETLDGILTYLNDNFCHILGLERDEVLNSSAVSLIYFEEDLAIFTEIGKSIRSGKNWSGEIRLRANDGSEIWTQTTAFPRRNWLGQLSGTIIVRTDITESKRSQTAEALVSIFDDLAEQVAIFSIEDGTLDYMNKSAKVLFGLQNSDLGIIRLRDTNIKYDIALVQREVAALIKSQVEFVDFVLALAGTPFDVRVQNVEVHSGERQLIAFFRDRTDKIALEQEKSQFVSTVSHELRTPLTSIKGAVDLALSNDNDPLPERTRRLLSIAQRNANRLILIVNDILDLEKMDAGLMEFTLKPTKLKTFVDDVIQSIQPYLDELGVSAAIDATSDDPTVKIDPDRMTQVLTNLLSNAAKFSRQGEKVLVKLWGSGGNSGFSVVDNGHGIPESEIEHIFERFHQVASARQNASASSGLGLAIVKTIVERHDGRVWLESKVDQGTSVHCEFATYQAGREDVHLTAGA